MGNIVSNAGGFYKCEIAGWCLLAAGLHTFYKCFQLLSERQIFEAGEGTVIGFFIFRGGLFLIKVAVAARVCTDAQQRPEKEPAAGALGTAPARRAPWQPTARRVP